MAASSSYKTKMLSQLLLPEPNIKKDYYPIEKPLSGTNTPYIYVWDIIVEEEMII